MAEWICLITGVLGIGLTQVGDPELLKWSSVLGLMGQPFWLYETYRKNQYKLFTLSIIYMFFFLNGIRVYWF